MEKAKKQIADEMAIYVTPKLSDHVKALDKIRLKYGDQAKILTHRTVRLGGFLGLFTREGVEITGYRSGTAGRARMPDLEEEKKALASVRTRNQHGLLVACQAYRQMFNVTGAIKLWVEVGLPDFDKLHRAAKLAERVAVYTHRDPLQLIRALAGRGLFRGAEIPLISFDRAFLAQLAERIGRRAAIDLSVTEQSLYVHIDGHSIEGRMDVKQGLE